MKEEIAEGVSSEPGNEDQGNPEILPSMLTRAVESAVDFGAVLMRENCQEVSTPDGHEFISCFSRGSNVRHLNPFDGKQMYSAPANKERRDSDFSKALRHYRVQKSALKLAEKDLLALFQVNKKRRETE